MRFVALSLLAACEPAATYVASPVPAIVASIAQHAQLIAYVADAARNYHAWPRVDNVLRAAPIPCAAGDLD